MTKVLKFIRDVELRVTFPFASKVEEFKKGEEYCVEIFVPTTDPIPNTISIKFPDGNSCCDVPLDAVELSDYVIDEINPMEIALEALHVARDGIKLMDHVSHSSVDNDNDSGEVIFTVGGREFTLSLKETTSPKPLKTIEKIT